MLEVAPICHVASTQRVYFPACFLPQYTCRQVLIRFPYHHCWHFMLCSQLGARHPLFVRVDRLVASLPPPFLLPIYASCHLYHHQYHSFALLPSRPRPVFEQPLSYLTMSATTAATTATKKRKSDATTPAAAKKAKLAAVAHAETVESILSDVKNFELPDSPTATRKMILELAKYARTLEEEVDATKPKALSRAELEAAAEKLAKAAKSGIRKQLTVGFLLR